MEAENKLDGNLKIKKNYNMRILKIGIEEKEVKKFKPKKNFKKLSNEALKEFEGSLIKIHARKEKTRNKTLSGICCIKESKCKTGAILQAGQKKYYFLNIENIFFKEL